MDKQILYAKNISELLSLKKNNLGTQIIGGCTKIDEFPKKAISTRNIPDLCQVIRHEQYIAVGPGATISDILEKGNNHLPSIIIDAMNSIANPIIRNTATIGGNICSEGHKNSLFAPLLALDAKLEFRNQTETKNISIRNYNSIPEGYILSNIKIPLVDSEISIFRRIGPENLITPDSASFAFLANTEKNSLISVQLAFAGPFVFYSNNLENLLLGKRLPLNQKDIIEIEESVEQEFHEAATDQMIGDEVRQQFFNLVRYSFEQLT